MAKKVTKEVEITPKGEEIVEVDKTTDIDGIKKDLENGFEDVQNRRRQVNSNVIINKNKVEEKRQEVLQLLMSSLSDFGVDLNDVASIGQFMQKLEEQNPDMAQLFKIAFGNLTKGDFGAESASPGTLPGPDGLSPSSTAPAVQQGGLLENRFGNLAKGILQPNGATPSGPSLPVGPGQQLPPV